jgi:hypothetical protein
MRRLIGLLMLAGLAFYVAWPAWSGYRIATALSNKDAAALDSKVDFPSVRESLRPAVTAELGKRIDKEMSAMGSVAGALGGDLKQQLQGKLVDQALAALVTPDTVIRIAHDGRSIAASVEKVLAEAAGQIGAMSGGSGAATTGGTAPAGGLLGQVLGAAGGTAGTGAAGGDLAAVLGKALGGLKKPGEPPAAPPADADKAPAAAGTRSFGLGNVKGFRFAGPLAFDIAVARDAAQATADGTVGMSFSGGDWKLTRVVPNM